MTIQEMQEIINALTEKNNALQKSVDESNNRNVAIMLEQDNLKKQIADHEVSISKKDNEINIYKAVMGQVVAQTTTTTDGTPEPNVDPLDGIGTLIND